MRYISTRRKSRPVTFGQAVLRGQAPDGGLYVPVSIPELSPPGKEDAATVAELAQYVLPAWIGRDLASDLAKDVFSIDIPVVDLGVRNPKYRGMYVAELFHGPTGSFKDFAARFLARWLSTELPPLEAGRVVLVATSGDTGSAVAEGFSGRPGTSVVVLYPHEGVSRFQRAQLTKPRTGVHSFAVRGSFDDCQRAVKEAFNDGALSHVDLTSANSINIGRLLPQMLFYFWSVMRIDRTDPVFVVPSGNLGNLCAGLMAGKSGIPDARFVAATNENRYVVDYLSDRETKAKPVRRTLSNAMDVAVPSNLERITRLFRRSDLNARLTAMAVSDEETKQTIRSVWTDTEYLVDPHTAVGLKAALSSGNQSGRAMIVMGTAHPDKYRELIHEVTGLPGVSAEKSPDIAEEQVIDSGLPALRNVIMDVVDRSDK